MKREFPSEAVQRQSSVLHNQICRLSTPKEMAAVSAHLRNYVVAETVAIIGSLDSHPKIIGPPCVFGSPATHQQARGTRPNPFTHVAPSGLRIANTENPTAFLNSDKARQFVERMFGMGVIAPVDWSKSGAFTTEPRQLNVLDNVAESYKSKTGLVGAFVSTAEDAASAGVWNGSGRHQHNETSLMDFVSEFYRNHWRPRAAQAYSRALVVLAARLKAARQNSDDDKAKATQDRIELLDTQVKTFERDTPSLREAVRMVTKAMSDEKWS